MVHELGEGFEAGSRMLCLLLISGKFRHTKKTFADNKSGACHNVLQIFRGYGVTHVSIYICAKRSTIPEPS